MNWIVDYLDWPLSHFIEDAKRDEEFAISYWASALNEDYFRKLGIGSETRFARDYVKRKASKLYDHMMSDKSLTYWHR